MSLPFELSWGIDTVIKKLRPGANFTLMGTTIIDWKDSENRPAPTWEEINSELEKLHTTFVQAK
jgi:hypothetical protein